MPGLMSTELQIPKNHLDNEKIKILLNMDELSLSSMLETLTRQEIVMLLQYNHIWENYEGICYALFYNARI
jgi:hypothetical protein